jgi:nucleoside 2-deoxyribosyltransferase
MNKLKHSLVYLSGPMDNAPDGGVEWRKKVTPILHKMGIGVLDPCNKPAVGHKEDSTFRGQIQKLKDENKFEEVRNLMKDVVGIDLRMVDLAHFILVKVDPTIHMCGTYWEVCYAVQQHKPIILFCEQGLNRIPNWLFGVADYMAFCTSLDMAVTYIQNVDDGNLELDRRWRFFDFDKIFGE